MAVIAASGALRAQDAEAAPAINTDRIMGVMPNYTTVNDPNALVAPLTVKQKWSLFVKESIDPFNLVSAAVGAAFSQSGDQTPKYGEGMRAFGSRYGAAVGDLTTQTFFSTAVLACVLHQDPRYFRMGPEHNIVRRVGYSLSRLVVTRQDSGGSAFNYSNVGGMALGIAASNLYYPTASQRGDVMADRLLTSFTGGITGNLLSEFWPDIQKVLHRKARSKAASVPAS